MRTVLALSVLLCLALPAAAAPTKVGVRGGQHADYTRIVFEWPNPVSFQAAINDGGLDIAFAEPFAADWRELLATLGDAVAAATPSADGRSVRLELRRPAVLRSQAMTNLAVFDLLRPDSAAAAQPAEAGPATPARAAAPPPAAAPPLDVRVGRHDGYTRLVFDWKREVPYKVERAAGSVDVRFAAAAVPQIAALRRAPPAPLTGIAADTAADATTVALSVGDGVTFRHFRLGNRVVVDLLPGKPAAKRDEVPRAAAKAEPRAPGATKPDAAKAEAAKPEAPGTGRDRAAAGRSGESLSPAGQRTLERVQEAVQQFRAAETAETATAEPAPAKPAPAPVGAPLRLTPQAAASAAPAPAPAPPAAPPAFRPVPPPPAAAAVPAPAAAAAEPQVAGAADPGGPATLSVRREVVDEGVRLHFDWSRPVKAVAFERAGQLWLGFDAPATADIAAIADGQSWVLTASQEPVADATVLRLGVRGGLFPALRRDGNRWTLRLSGAPGGPTAPILAVPQPPEAGPPKIMLPVGAAGRAVRVFDREVGDDLLLVPVGTVGAGIAVRQDFVDFRLLPTAQGIAVAAWREDLTVDTRPSGVLIGAPGGLALSPAAARRTSPELEGGAVALQRDLLPLADAYSPPAEFILRRQQLLGELGSTADRTRTRLDLAQLYLANGFTAEATALVAMVEKDDPEVRRRPAVRALAGVSRYLSGRSAAAETELMHPDLDRYPDVRLWRGAVFSDLGQYVAAGKSFASGAGSLAAMPAPLRRRMLGEWARAALGSRDLGAFAEAAKALDDLPAAGRDDGRIALLRGLVAEGRGDTEQAVGLYRMAEEAGREPRARAALARTELELKEGRIERAAAIAELERLRFAWRGDDFEPTVLRRLAALHAENGDFREALAVSRQAVALARGSERAREETRAMSELFTQMFLDGQVDRVSPLDALALYYEFQELTPAGRDGDELIRRLADRLVGVDLLDRAAGLLENQLKQRLTGPDRAPVANRVAEIRLKDKDPQKALAALDLAPSQGLAPEVQSARQFLRARALGDLGRRDEALAEIAADRSAGAEKLRAELAWQAKDWSGAARSLAGLLGERWRDPAPLGGEERHRILRLAVAYYLGDDRASLARLGEQYGKALGEGAEAESLKMLTQGDGRANADARQRAASIAATADLEAFMSSLRGQGRPG